MKIGILSRNAQLYSTQRLIEAAQDRGHEVKVIDALRCYMNINSDKPQIHFKGEELSGFDAVIPRIGASVTSSCQSTLSPLSIVPARKTASRSAIL